MITHGDEQASFYKLNQLLSALREHRVRVYILAYVMKHNTKAVAFIDKLARESNGQAIIAESADELEQKAASLMSLLRRR